MAVASGNLSIVELPANTVAQDAPAKVCRMAIIPTNWGNCAVTWCTPTDHNHKPYHDLPQNGLLSRIMVPGLAEAEIRARFPDAMEVLPDRNGTFRAQTVPPWFGELVAFLQDYYASDLRPADAPDQPAGLPVWPRWRSRLDLSQVTPFQLRVLDVVASIPRGQAWTYGQVARELSAPQASRAVGSALARNPWPVLIPCHRVIASTGRLTGFTAPGGVATKLRMLQLEGYHNPACRV